ncbi:MAG: uroporphyrinogen-III C-methyltransferase [Thermostichales cyanobacterium BF4_bins_65]
MGVVYLVGAGPGDPDLLTVKAQRLLRQCDLVVYDALVSEAVLALIHPQAERIYVGKSKDQHTLPQEHITALLIEKAPHYQQIVRLKGGDPFVFGRGGEEMLALVQAGIPVEVVPGITAGLAVPAYAGIPVTHRDWSSSVLLVTGHEGAGKYQPRVNWRRLATCVDTLVIYMGVHHLEFIVAELVEGGLSPETPVAILRWGTTPQQSRLLTTLGSLLAGGRPGDLAPPAIVVIGAVVALSHQLPEILIPHLWQDLGNHS